ncbi:hypothetical protein BU23DRAFT_655120 [Bimuria novae-zelandiae CBS 107.79]|uniref:DUF6594 domain-containing protein n=1 Tax=Bimuria novae-zelandiae CBS 107.79 TaxID=1447943 RepID=A0A6A5UVC3_9PLEO|nr:hypothetical protein BU23DRAFT_655120 [Bimuria novae-zelandiae CBS 107.79]
MVSGPITTLDGLVTGYPKLAGQMGLIPETQIFRSFSALNARNLLYLQAELEVLEKRLIEKETEDSRDGRGKRDRYAVDFEWLNEPEDGEPTDQRDLVLEIREVLEKYRRALVEQSIINNLEEPNSWDLRFIQYFLSSDAMGPLALIGEDRGIWGSVKKPKDFRYDLVTLKARRQEDAFSRFVSENAVHLFKCGLKRLKPSLTKHGITAYEDTTVKRITRWVSNVVASLIPILSIVVLNGITSRQGRLGAIVGFNFLISACLSAFTNAKRVEVFAVAAA